MCNCFGAEQKRKRPFQVTESLNNDQNSPKTLNTTNTANRINTSIKMKMFDLIPKFRFRESHKDDLPSTDVKTLNIDEDTLKMVDSRLMEWSYLIGQNSKESENKKCTTPKKTIKSMFQTCKLKSNPVIRKSPKRRKRNLEI